MHEHIGEKVWENRLLMLLITNAHFHYHILENLMLFMYTTRSCRQNTTFNCKFALLFTTYHPCFLKISVSNKVLNDKY